MADFWYSRVPGETDDAYFMRILSLARVKYPTLEEPLLWYGVRDATGLPCFHPFHLLEYDVATHLRRPPSGIYKEWRPALLNDYLDSEPRHLAYDPERMKRRWEYVHCPVCDTLAPREPVDIRAIREARLLHVLVAVSERHMEVTDG